MQRQFKRLALAAFCLVCASAQANAPALNVQAVARDGLTKAQAKQVLIVVLRQQTVKLSRRGMSIDDDIRTAEGKPFRPGYHDFPLTFDSPKVGATDVLGTHSVNIGT